MNFTAFLLFPFFFFFSCYIFSTWNESRKLFQVKQIRRQSPHGLWHWKDANDSHITSCEYECECECMWMYLNTYAVKRTDLSCWTFAFRKQSYFGIFLATIVATFPHIMRFNTDAFKLYSYSYSILIRMWTAYLTQVPPAVHTNFCESSRLKI